MPISSLQRILNADNEIAFGYRIGYLFNHFAGPVYKWSSGELGIQRPEFATLFCACHLEAATASDVVALTGIPKNSVSRAVSNLEELGCIRRTDDTADRRRSILVMTPKGRKVFEKVLPRFVARQERMLSVLSPAELREFDRLLHKLVERGDDWAAEY